MSEKAQLVVEGKKLAVSNLNKILYPKVGFTKGQVIDYYIRIAVKYTRDYERLLL
jgi:bifunctional non-homologous end joining protein LigD